ncbi:hypothetical protein NG701_17055 [Pseudarthrobacter sp. HLT3-5]|uniref:hypothetical protein n=1 Tax=Pseudarthrobacter cellobiosi TaxID=2953654 RepID=UPI00208FD4B5|nr:hypothetical protein [Pseudarthrobacter sp. HLT3-5]MCO4276112.1 hypothetical protein [Pseudarthrobacter sp. HLT3-5]
MIAERVKRDCQCPRANHQHGTPIAYVVDKCRCTPCTDANTKREQARAAGIAAGTYDVGRVDAGPVREHILALGKRGYGLKTLARVAGVSNATLGKIIYGDPSRNMPPRARVETRVAERVLAVRPSLSTVGATTKVKAGPTQARIRTLACLGYSVGWQWRRLGREMSNSTRVMEHELCNAETARAVRDLYLLLWDKPRVAANRHEAAAISRTINRATAAGWEQLPSPHLSSSEAPVNPDKSIDHFLQERMKRQMRRRA